MYWQHSIITRYHHHHHHHHQLTFLECSLNSWRCCKDHSSWRDEITWERKYHKQATINEAQRHFGEGRFDPTTLGPIALLYPTFAYPHLPLSAGKWPPSPARRSGERCELLQCGSGQSLVSEMTCYVSSGTLNPTHSLTRDKASAAKHCRYILG